VRHCWWCYAMLCNAHPWELCSSWVYKLFFCLNDKENPQKSLFSVRSGPPELLLLLFFFFFLGCTTNSCTLQITHGSRENSLVYNKSLVYQYFLYILILPMHPPTKHRMASHLKVVSFSSTEELFMNWFKNAT